MKMNFIDKTIAYFNPKKGAERAKNRAKLEFYNSGYSRHGASTFKSALKGMIASPGDPNDDTTANVQTLAARSRDLFYSTSLATGAIKTIRTNVVGHGLQLNSNIDHDFLGITREEADQWERNTEREFKLWADSNNCDIMRTMTFGQMQGLILISALLDGDVFVALPIKPRKGVAYDLRLSLIEADRVGNPDDIQAGYEVNGGIEVDADGEKIACYIADFNPNSQTMMSRPKYRRVEFYGKKTGRPNVLHIAQDWERPGQRRAVPLLSPVIEELKQLGRYTDAELMNAVVSGMFTVFITTPTPNTPLGDAIPIDQQIDSQNDDSYELGNGAIIGLQEGEDVKFANPDRPNSAFNDFVTTISRQIGTALELPYELLVKHFTASYSASRAALLEAWKMFRMRRSWLIQNLCQPVYEEWLTEAILKGRIEAPGFFDDEAIRKAWAKSEWYGPSQGYLNPLNEVQAAKVAVDEEFTTREKATAEMTGEPWDSVHNKRATEEQKRRSDGTIKNSEDYMIEDKE